MSKLSGPWTQFDLVWNFGGDHKILWFESWNQWLIPDTILHTNLQTNFFLGTQNMRAEGKFLKGSGTAPASLSLSMHQLSRSPICLKFLDVVDI